MTLPPVLTLHFWFQPLPPPFLPLNETIVGVVVIAVGLAGVAAVIAAARAKLEKPIRRAVSSLGWQLVLTMLYGLLLLALLEERVGYLSMRAFWVIWLAWVGFALYFAYRALWITWPKMKAQYGERAKYEKWLPKAKK